MTVNNETVDYNILGSHVRLKSDHENHEKALCAIKTLQSEIENIQSSSPKLKDIDVAVLAALNLASKNHELEKEFKESVLSLRGGIQDALGLIEEVSPGTMQN